MKLLYFNYMADLYGRSIGSTIKAKKLLSNLERAGHKVDYYWRFGGARKRPETPSPARPPSPFRHFIRKLFYTPKTILQNNFEIIAEFVYIQKAKPELIIVRLDAFRISAVILARLMNVPVLLEADGAMSYEWLHYHNDGALWKSFLLFFERIDIRLAEKIFVQSNVTKQYYVTTQAVRREKITVITNAADIPLRRKKMPPEVKEKINFPSGARVIGFIGSLHLWHGVDNLHRLMASLIPKYADLYFLFVGSGGPMTVKLRSQCQKGEWQHRVVFIDYLDHELIPFCLEVMDIALAPYPDSGLFYYSPVKIFEYMAGGKVVVTTKVGQIAEIIQDGENGIFFDPNNNDDLENKITRLLDNPSLGYRIGANAREFIAQGRTWKDKSRELEKLCLDYAKRSRKNISCTF